MGLEDHKEQRRWLNDAISFLGSILVKSEQTMSRSGSVSRITKINTLMEENEKPRNIAPVATENDLSVFSNDVCNYRIRTPLRIRSFKTSKGTVTATKGDRRESSSSDNSHIDSNGRRISSVSSDDSAICSNCSNGYFRVGIIGANAVGKRTLLNQFTSSERMCSNVFEIGELDDTTLSVVIDDEESTLEFVDLIEDDAHLYLVHVERFPVDAYVLVYSVHERPTYDVAIRYLEYIRNEQFSDRPIIIVANKVDLVRKRQVSSDEARHLAITHDCKYIETSATLDHHVNELLVAILTQIKLKLNPDFTKEKITSASKDTTCFKGLFNKLFHLKPKVQTTFNVF